MKKRFALVVTGVLAILSFSVLVFVSTSNTNASQSPEKEIEQVSKSFFKAIDDKNADDMIKYSLDRRFPNDDVRKNEYSQLFNSDNVKFKNLLSTNKINETSYEITVEVVTKDNGAITTTLPVTFVDGAWKVVIGQDQQSK